MHGDSAGDIRDGWASIGRKEGNDQSIMPHVGKERGCDLEQSWDSVGWSTHTRAGAGRIELAVILEISHGFRHGRPLECLDANQANNETSVGCISCHLSPSVRLSITPSSGEYACARTYVQPSAWYDDVCMACLESRHRDSLGNPCHRLSGSLLPMSCTVGYYLSRSTARDSH